MTVREAGKEVFAARRQKFFDFLGDAAAILPSAPERVRSNDTNYIYRQDNDFYYLTGFAEPEAVAVFLPPSAAKRYLLFVRARDPEKEVWNGRRAGVEGARRDYGVDEAYPIEEFEKHVVKALEGVNSLHFGIGRETPLRRRILAAISQARSGRQRRGGGPEEFHDPGTFLAEQRLRKDGFELASLRRACDITCEAHRQAMRFAAPGRFEYQVEAVLDYTFRTNGGSGWGYPHIVAGGVNATILHYNENTDPLRDGDLLLIDAGAEYDYYSADVTRTFPVNGSFSRDQRLVYDLVLRAHGEAIKEVAPGKPFDAAHQRAVRVLTEGLVEIGILDGAIDELVEKEAFKPYYMHRTGHWLGMDVHDVGLYVEGGRARALEPGMVLTVEPGLYFGDFCGDIGPRFRGIGVRIEDDVLVTEKGCEVLTESCPRNPEEMEALCRQEIDAATLPEISAPADA